MNYCFLQKTLLPVANLTDTDDPIKGPMLCLNAFQCAVTCQQMLLLSTSQVLQNCSSVYYNYQTPKLSTSKYSSVVAHSDQLSQYTQFQLFAIKQIHR